MANYYAYARSSYFPVKDEAAFRAWAAERSLVIWDDDQKDKETGEQLFGLSAENHEAGWPTSCYRELTNDAEDQDEYFEVDVAEELRAHLKPRWAAVLVQIGWEKLRYLTGDVCVVTPTRVKYGSLWDLTQRLVPKNVRWTLPEY